MDDKNMPHAPAQITTLAVSGLFMEKDWADLVRVLRYIEDRHPEVDYKAAIIDGNVDITTEEGIDFLRRTFPHRPGHPLQFFKRNRGGKTEAL